MLPNKIRRITLLAAFCLSVAAHNAAASIMANYYVSAAGHDSWPGTEAQPFKTIQKARDVVRAIPGPWTGDVYVWIREGTYMLTGTLEFTEADSGRDGYYVAYQAYTGERPVISGGTQITGWLPYQSGIYRAACGAMEFRQLYVDNKKAIRARTPDAGKFNRLVSWNTANQTIRINSGELGNVQNLSNGRVEMIVQQYWAESIMRIASVSAGGSFTDISVNNTEKNIVFDRAWPLKSPDQAYHFENSLDFLDGEGEWYLDNNSYPHYVYYKPYAGENLAAAVVMAPSVETLVNISGAGLSSHAHHLIFEGITFEHATWTRPTFHGNIGLQSQQFSIGNDRCERPGAAFFVENADHLRFTRNVFRNCGSTGLDIYTGTNNIVVEGNVFHDLSGNGMQIGRFSEADTPIAAVYNPADTREYCEAHVVANNYIYTCGTDYYCANGIAAGYIRSTSIIHNEVTGLPYTGINSGWGWNTSVSAMTNNHIGYNRIYDVMNLLCDGGGIYTLGNQGPASTITHNYIYNTVRSVWATTQYTYTYPVASIYLDQGSCGFTVDQNCVVNTNPGWRVHFNGTASCNTAGTNPEDDASIVNNAGIQSSFQDIKLIDPMPTPQQQPAWPIPAAGLKLWLKADAGPGAIVKDAGNRVSAWSDLSGNTNTALQTTQAYQTEYIAGAINGKPALRFDGANDRMDVFSLTGDMNDYTFAMVIAPDGLSDYNQSIGALGAWGQFLFHASAGGAIYCGTDVAARLTAPGGTMTDAEVQEFTFVYPGTGSAAALYRNGTQVADGVLAQAPAAWTGFLLGSAGASTLKGDVPEIIVYDRALSAAGRQTVETYLAGKYGFSLQQASQRMQAETYGYSVPEQLPYKVFPTITQGDLYVDLNLQRASAVEISIYSIEGYEVKHAVFKDVPEGENRLKLDVGDLSNRLYIYQVKTNAYYGRGKFQVLK